jgi:hypothetical protein
MPVPDTTGWSGGTVDEALCTLLTQGMLARIEATTLSRQALVPASWSSTCQMEVVEKENPGRGAVFTVVYKGTAMWMVTCNLDPADGRARADCDRVLQSRKFSATG